MGLNKGKEWEQCVVREWGRNFPPPSSFILRLPDQQSGNYYSSNVSDFIAFNPPMLFFIECKSIKKGNTINFRDLTQYDSLLEYKDIPNVFPGFLIWWREKKKVAWVPVETITYLKASGFKSVHLNMIGCYNIVEIPSETKIVYPKLNLTPLLTIRK